MMEVLTQRERCSDTVSRCYPLSSTDVLWKTCNTNQSTSRASVDTFNLFESINADLFTSL